MYLVGLPKVYGAGRYSFRLVGSNIGLSSAPFCLGIRPSRASLFVAVASRSIAWAIVWKNAVVYSNTG